MGVSVTIGYDVAVLGGGLVGAAIAYGLARGGARVALLDEGDVALRAARGNFGLVWVQSKGLGMPEYSAWTRRSSNSWSSLHAELREETGADVAFSRPGGLHLCLSEEELAQRAAVMHRLHNQSEAARFPSEIVDRKAVAALEPAIGPEVVGACFCPLDGHANPLKLLRGLHQALQRRGGAYRPNHGVEAIRGGEGRFALDTAGGLIEADKVVLAAGHGNARLAPMVGLAAPIRPLRGQIIVTERVRPFLSRPTVFVRQTDEGSVLIGDSHEDVGFDDSADAGVLAVMAKRAVRLFPRLAGARLVRAWGALRVMTPDGFPIYQQSATCPGAFIAICHSGVTLAAAHALHLAPHIAAGRLPAEFDVFSARRFDVQAAA